MIATGADVEIAPEEKLYASLVQEAGVTIPHSPVASLKELSLGEYEKCRIRCIEGLPTL